jgi:PIN domain nuclease of toxin-antitoxin system
MPKLENNYILLDTHIWIWLMNGDKRVQSTKFLNFIEHNTSQNNILVSIISVWEVAMLESNGKIALPYDCLDWVKKALRAPGICLTMISPQIAVESTRLQGSFHGDPADRILIATAKDRGATLITSDKNILSYAKNHGFGAMNN